MSGQLEGQVALITGAGQGVGRGIALALAKAGAAVMLVGRTQDKLQAVREEIESFGHQAATQVCNVRDSSGLATTVSATVGQYSRLDILVNCAQEVPLGRLEETSDEAIAGGWESGPLATFRLMKLCLPHLRARGGNIINLASSSAYRWDLAGYGAYAAVKESIRQLTRAAACEWAQYGIRSNCILPLGNSPAMDGWTRARPEESASFVASVPQKRIGDCEIDIGNFVVSLCTPACAYINGQSIGVDGGQAFLG